MGDSDVLIRHLRTTLRLSLTALAVSATLSLTPAAQAQEQPIRFDEPSRVVAFGFIAGQIEPFRAALLETGLINEDDQWIGGDAHLVLLGNVTHYGDEVLQCVDLIRSLQDQAAESSGMVHMLLGRAEFMMLRGDLTTLEPPNYADLADEDSEARLAEVLAQWRAELLEYNGDQPERTRNMLNQRFADRFEREYEVGAVEWMDLFSPGSERGEWLRSRPAVIKIGDLIYSHGGVSPEWANEQEMTLEQMNEVVHAEINKPGVWVPAMADQDSPIWYRQFIVQDQRVNDAPTLETLRRLNAIGQVISDSPILGESVVRGRIYCVGSGLTPDFESDVIVGAMEKTGQGVRFLAKGEWYKARVVGPLPAAPEQAKGDDSDNDAG